MTAYLKPGDRIFFVYPKGPNPRVDEDNVTALKGVFAAVGVESFGSMGSSGVSTFEIVAVLRDE